MLNQKSQPSLHPKKISARPALHFHKRVRLKYCTSGRGKSQVFCKRKSWCHVMIRDPILALVSHCTSPFSFNNFSWRKGNCVGWHEEILLKALYWTPVTGVMWSIFVRALLEEDGPLEWTYLPRVMGSLNSSCQTLHPSDLCQSTHILVYFDSGLWKWIDQPQFNALCVCSTPNISLGGAKNIQIIHRHPAIGQTRADLEFFKELHPWTMAGAKNLRVT